MIKRHKRQTKSVGQDLEILKTLKNPSFFNRLLRKSGDGRTMSLLKPRERSKPRSSFSMMGQVTPNSLSLGHFFPNKARSEKHNKLLDKNKSGRKRGRRLAGGMRRWKSSLDILKKGLDVVALKNNMRKQRLNQIFYVRKKVKTVRRKMRDFNNNTVMKLDLMDVESRQLFTVKQKQLKRHEVKKKSRMNIRASRSAQFIEKKRSLAPRTKTKTKKRLKQNFLSGTKFFKIKSREVYI